MPFGKMSGVWNMKPHIDLHMHSSASDGMDTPAGLRERVKRRVCVCLP